MAITRRQALIGLGAAGVAGCKPAPQSSLGGDSGKGDTAAPGTIDTIVVVMMENRSFDHFLGALKLADGRTDVEGLDADMQNVGNDGLTYGVSHATETCTTADPPHGWDSGRVQLADGTNEGFVVAYQNSYGTSVGAEVMSYYTRDDLPITYALADSYAVCDNWFCSVLTSTWPNRIYGHAGTSEGVKYNDLPETGGGFDMPTIWTKLDEIAVPWRYYYTDLPFIVLFNDHFRDGTWGMLEDFLTDAAVGALPPVCWVDPAFGYNDNHPPHHVGLGEEFLAAVYKAMANSPHWERCLLVITYDEHGGFFDHVPPPTIDDDYADEGFNQLGFRVPALVIGPYVKQGVSKVQFDNTSWIKLVCDMYGIEPWTARLKATTSLSEAIDWDRLARNEPLAPASLPDFDINDDEVPAECVGNGVFGPTVSAEQGADANARDPYNPPGHQVELQAFVRRFFPDLDRTPEAPGRLAKLRIYNKTGRWPEGG